MKNFSLAWLLLFLVAGCCSPAVSGDNRPASDDGDLLRFTGRVVFVSLEGGFYGLVAEDGRKYDPLNLPQEYRRDGLQVRVTARPVQNAVGFHMWGTRIEIINIKRL